MDPLRAFRVPVCTYKVGMKSHKLFVPDPSALPALREHMTRLQGDGAIYFWMACLPFIAEHPFAWVFLCVEILTVSVISSMCWCSDQILAVVQWEVCLGVGWNTQPLPCPVSISCDSGHHLRTRHSLRDILLWRRWHWKCHSPPVIVECHPAAKYQAAACSLPPHGEEKNRGEKK